MLINVHRMFALLRTNEARADPSRDRVAVRLNWRAMSTRPALLAVFAFVFACASAPPPAPPAPASAPTVAPAPVVAPAGPPAARRVPHPRTLHGRTLDDDYFWLRQKD